MKKIIEISQYASEYDIQFKVMEAIKKEIDFYDQTRKKKIIIIELIEAEE